MFSKVFSKFFLLPKIQKQQIMNKCTKPTHLICFKFWTEQMVKDIINSAINLKCKVNNTHCKSLDILNGCKVTVVLDVNEPTLAMAVSKAASLLGAYDNIVTDKLIWEQDYFGRIFSAMSDVIFVSTNTHTCLQRFADQSSVPVLCMKSRTHATIQSLSTVMAIKEAYGSLNGLKISYCGPPAPILNSYLLLCPMLDADILFKCSCDKCPFSPLLYKVSEKVSERHHTVMKACSEKDEILKDTRVIIAGPTTLTKEKRDVFKLDIKDIVKATNTWIFFHSCPRGDEVGDDIFNHKNSMTFVAFENMQYVTAALMAKVVLNLQF